MDPSLVLFDMSAYRGRIEPTLKDFFAGGAEGAILHLLQETNRCVTENEPLRRRLLLRGIEPGRSIIRLLTGQSPLSTDDDLSKLGTKESRQALEHYVSGPVVYELLAILCIPDLPGIDPQQNLGDSPFLPFAAAFRLDPKRLQRRPVGPRRPAGFPSGNAIGGDADCRQRASACGVENLACARQARRK